MCRYDDPETAFRNSGQRIKKGQAFVHLYQVDDALRGHEIVVASSNNKAVENVNAELPGIEAVSEETALIGYFKSVSDNLLDRKTWGIVAAVLGNAKNRSEFRQKFWWDEELGMHRFLQQASGNPQFITEKNEDGTTRQRVPRIVMAENPPEDRAEAVRRWKKARARFRSISGETKSRLATLQKASDLLAAIAGHEEKLRQLPTKARRGLERTSPGSVVIYSKPPWRSTRRSSPRQPSPYDITSTV